VPLISNGIKCFFLVQDWKLRDYFLKKCELFANFFFCLILIRF
jgi:hypothetical protein